MLPILLLNPGDKSWTKHRYILWFGAYGEQRLMVWANSLEDALDECVDWIADNAPGLLADEQVNEAYREAIAEGMSAEDAYDHATVDVTTAGNASNHLNSWEWGILDEDPSNAFLVRMAREGYRFQVASC